MTVATATATAKTTTTTTTMATTTAHLRLTLPSPSPNNMHFNAAVVDSIINGAGTCKATTAKVYNVVNERGGSYCQCLLKQGRTRGPHKNDIQQ